MVMCYIQAKERPRFPENTRNQGEPPLSATSIDSPSQPSGETNLTTHWFGNSAPELGDGTFLLPRTHRLWSFVRAAQASINFEETHTLCLSGIDWDIFGIPGPCSLSGIRKQ